MEGRPKREKRGIFKSRLFWCAAIPLGGFLLLFAAQALYAAQQAAPAPAPAPIAAISAAPTPKSTPASTPIHTPAPIRAPEVIPVPTPYVRHYPVRVTFTKPGISSDIHALGKVDGAIGTVDSATDCAWYDASAVPRETGNCILSGHDRWAGEKGAFDWLKKAKKGDEVVVELDNGDEVFYTVEEKGEYPYDEFPRYHLYTYGDARLTLITCKGDYSANAGTSLTRVVVVCYPNSAGKERDASNE